MVLNLSETEKMVSEATNNEAWGASSTLMQQIAQGCVARPALNSSAYASLHSTFN